MAELLDDWKTHIERLEWSALLLDDDWRVHWVSPQLKEQLGETDEASLRYGSHVVDAFISNAWLRTVHPDSQADILQQIGPYILSHLEEGGRDLWTGIDRAVADELGIVGKHAGDGASAFFLVENLGSRSRAAAAAIRATRHIHEIAQEVAGDVVEGAGAMRAGDVVEGAGAMRVGIHWGAQPYIGQLVPGGRLDVTALGDDVNEAARIQEAAPPGETQASKQLIERLEPDDAASLGLDAEKLFYRTLADMPGAPEKAVRDAGALAVTSL